MNPTEQASEREKRLSIYIVGILIVLAGITALVLEACEHSRFAYKALELWLQEENIHYVSEKICSPNEDKRSAVCSVKSTNISATVYCPNMIFNKQSCKVIDRY